MIVLPETMESATTLNVRGGNGVWRKPKSLGNNKDGKPNKSVVGINQTVTAP